MNRAEAIAFLEGLDLYNGSSSSVSQQDRLDKAIEVLKKSEAQPVAWALCSPRSHTVLAVDQLKAEAENRLSRYGDVEGVFLRPLVFG